MKIDLHLHTLYSDGFISPKTLLQKASEKGLKIVSITDHDSIYAYQYLEQNKYENSTICLIPGIEFSVLDSTTGMEFHMLGLGIDYKNELLNQYLSRVYERETQRLKIMLEVSHELGLPDVSSLYDKRQLRHYGNGKMVFIRILEIKGVDKDGIAQFKKVVNERLRNLPRIQLEPFEAISLIKKCSGYSVLAHAGEYKLEDAELIKLVTNLKGYGLDGLEVYHSSHSKEYSQKLLEIANKEDLLISGGSDAHFYKSYGTIKRQLGTGTNNNLDIDNVSVVDKIMSENKVIKFNSREEIL